MKILGKESTVSSQSRLSRIYPENDGDDIVIAGMAGKFPNCHNIAEYEHCLYNKVRVLNRVCDNIKKNRIPNEQMLLTANQDWTEVKCNDI